MTGSEDGTTPDESAGSADRRIGSVGRADPTPVTDAMTTPRTTSPGREEPAEADVCDSCGEHNDHGGSYCLSCGVRFRREGPAPMAPGPIAKPVASQQPISGRPVEGVTEDPTDYWDEDDEFFAFRPPVPPSRRRLRIMLTMVLVIAFLILGFNTLRSTDEPVPSTTTVAAVEDAALRSYVAQISVLANDVADLRVTGRLINDAWEDRSEDYDTTLERMNALVSRVVVLPDRLGAVEVPDGADAAVHQRMIMSVSTLASATEGMLTGLQSSDDGEARRIQLTRFEAASAEFGNLADQVENAPEDGSTAPGG